MDLVMMDIEESQGQSSRAEEMISKGGITTDISVLAAREIGLVIIAEDAGSAISIREFEL